MIVNNLFSTYPSKCTGDGTTIIKGSSEPCKVLSLFIITSNMNINSYYYYQTLPGLYIFIMD